MKDDLARLRELNLTPCEDMSPSIQRELDVLIKSLIIRLEAGDRKIKADEAYDNFDCVHEAEQQCKCVETYAKLRNEAIEADTTWRTTAGK